jgi:hypothetical protein
MSRLDTSSSRPELCQRRWRYVGEQHCFISPFDINEVVRENSFNVALFGLAVS